MMPRFHYHLWAAHGVRRSPHDRRRCWNSKQGVGLGAVFCHSVTDEKSQLAAAGLELSTRLPAQRRADHQFTAYHEVETFDKQKYQRNDRRGSYEVEYMM